MEVIEVSVSVFDTIRAGHQTRLQNEVLMLHILVLYPIASLNETMFVGISWGYPESQRP